MTRSHLLAAGIVISGLLHAGPALASDEPDPAANTQSVLDEPKAAPAEAISNAEITSELAAVLAKPFATAAVADDTRLAQVNGMADLNVLEQNINVRNTSTVSGNIINGDPTTGTISIDGASFGGFNGLAMVNANTGNNVSINSAMNVNVAIQP
ncbi:hypothetical protein [Altererythrobacter sp. Root672]|uniref:hypothetical protein n=1 Tax=Altererythrobacter sp. Root672 TaxID=1736584 RepID=UPI0006FAF171|nr:hypothetical protein [Altererythrobacter sp. Root672]KRA83967.1 hypothetical protein ASD76_08165 [Altererythrobacter sp. Root672]